MSSAITKEQFEQALNALLNANRHARNKGEVLTELIRSTFSLDTRVSHITEDRQCGNRVSEQFRYKPQVVIFLCDDVVKLESLFNYISRNMFKGLEAVLIIGNQNPFVYHRLLVGKASDFTEWCEDAFSLSPSQLRGDIGQPKPQGEYHKNRIVFGAPGTGKSHQLDEESKDGFVEVERVTFYPTYSYYQFVGCYKPAMKVVGQERKVEYNYTEGPFLRVLKNAKKDPEHKKHLLIIEEINRANAAAVFGDTFQLLDRDESGNSKFPIAISNDLRDYLISEGITDHFLSIPDNMFIWATMNSADQGVFPLDTAFKRRWDFEYIDINQNEDKINQYSFVSNGNKYNWNTIRKAINHQLLISKVNEDKLLGPFFISLETMEDNKKFLSTFKSKVLMYLLEDAVRHNPAAIFKSEDGIFSYSIICNLFDKGGPNAIFNFMITPDSAEDSNIE